MFGSLKGLSHREFCKAAGIFVACLPFAFLLTSSTLAWVGPMPGAPPDERVLGLGPLWLSRIDYHFDGRTHAWTSAQNWWLLVPLIAVVAALSTELVRFALRSRAVKIAAS